MPFLLLKSIIKNYDENHFKTRVGHGVAWAIAPCIALIRAILGSIVRGQPLPDFSLAGLYLNAPFKYARGRASHHHIPLAIPLNSKLATG